MKKRRRDGLAGQLLSDILTRSKYGECGPTAGHTRGQEAGVSSKAAPGLWCPLSSSLAE